MRFPGIGSRGVCRVLVNKFLKKLIKTGKNSRKKPKKPKLSTRDDGRQKNKTIEQIGRLSQEYIEFFRDPYTLRCRDNNTSTRVRNATEHARRPDESSNYRFDRRTCCRRVLLLAERETRSDSISRSPATDICCPTRDRRARTHIPRETVLDFFFFETKKTETRLNDPRWLYFGRRFRGEKQTNPPNNPQCLLSIRLQLHRLNHLIQNQVTANWRNFHPSLNRRLTIPKRS